MDTSDVSGKPAPRRVLGLYLGIDRLFSAGSPRREQVVGWAYVDMAAHEIVGLGTCLSRPPQDPKTRESLAAGRRDARGARRLTKRRRDRRRHVLRALAAAGAVPKGADGDWMRPTRGERPVLELRVLGLDHVLDGRALARVCYALAGSRGYVPHGEGADDAEGRRVLSALEGNRERMAASGARTVGEWLAGLPRSRNRAGDYALCVPNALVMDEVRTLFARQRALGSALATEALEADVLRVLAWEHYDPAHDERVLSTVADDSYGLEGDDGAPLKAAATATLTSERLRALLALRGVRVREPGKPARGLTQEDVERAMGTLFSPVPLRGNRACKVTYAHLRRALALPTRARFEGVEWDDEARREPFAPRAWRRLRDSLVGSGASLARRLAEDRDLADAVLSALAYASSARSLARALGRVGGLSEGEREALGRLPFGSRAFKGYGRASLEAARALERALWRGGCATLAEAERACGLSRRDPWAGRARAGALPPYDDFDPSLRNPTLAHALAQARRVVNAVVSRYGMPDQVVVVSGGDLAGRGADSPRARAAARLRRQEASRARAEAARALGCDEADVTDAQVARQREWAAQGGRDLYTGAPIDQRRMLADQSYCALNHPLPFSRTGDRSRANTVLCLRTSAMAKGRRTPWEWLGSDPGAWEAFRSRVGAEVSWEAKADNLLAPELDATQTARRFARIAAPGAYATRCAVGWIGSCLDIPEAPSGRARGVSVRAVRAMERSFGLRVLVPDGNGAIRPSGAALRAAVAAACSPEALRACAEAADGTARGRLGGEPWEGFADLARASEPLARVCRVASHKVTGQALNDTTYRYLGTDEGGAIEYRGASRATRTSTGRRLDGQGGGVRLLGQQAFLRLYRDPEGLLARGGGWLACPVYVADVPDVRAGRFVPRTPAKGLARAKWPRVPEELVASGDFVDVHQGDLVVVDGEPVGEYRTIDVSNGSWVLVDPHTGEPVRGSTIRRLDASSRVVAAEPAIC